MIVLRSAFLAHLHGKIGTSMKKNKKWRGSNGEVKKGACCFLALTFIRSNTLASPQNILAALADSDLWRLKLATADRWGCDSFTVHAAGQEAIRDQFLAPTARQLTHLPFMSYTNRIFCTRTKGVSGCTDLHHAQTRHGSLASDHSPTDWT